MEYIYETNRIYCEDGEKKLIAEVTFPEVSKGIVCINHTFVDNSLRGQGIASELLTLATQLIRENGWKTRATCSYAQKWFEKHDDYSDVFIG